MPFIVTTTETPASLHHPCGRILAERATLMFSEAVDEVGKQIEDAFPQIVDKTLRIARYEADFDCDHIKDTGGAVGPLPNGRIIAVRHVTIADLWERIGKPAGATYRQIVQGFNTQHHQAA